MSDTKKVPSYRATLVIEGLPGEDPAAVRGVLETKLSKVEIPSFRVVSIEPMTRRRAAAFDTGPRRAAPAEGGWRRESNAGGILLLVAIAWAAWFGWSILKVFFASEL